MQPGQVKHHFARGMALGRGVVHKANSMYKRGMQFASDLDRAVHIGKQGLSIMAPKLNNFMGDYLAQGTPSGGRQVPPPGTPPPRSGNGSATFRCYTGQFWTLSTRGRLPWLWLATELSSRPCMPRPRRLTLPSRDHNPARHGRATLLPSRGRRMQCSKPVMSWPFLPSKVMELW